MENKHIAALLKLDEMKELFGKSCIVGDVNVQFHRAYNAVKEAIVSEAHDAEILKARRILIETENRWKDAVDQTSIIVKLDISTIRALIKELEKVKSE